MKHFLIYIASAYALGILTLIYKGQKKMALTLADIKQQVADLNETTGEEFRQLSERFAAFSESIKGRLSAEQQEELRVISEGIAAAKSGIESMSNVFDADSVTPEEPTEPGNPEPTDTERFGNPDPNNPTL